MTGELWDLADIVEVAEAHTWRVSNALLAKGYRLLTITGTSRVVKHPHRENEVLVQRGMTYVFGRTSEQEPFRIPNAKDPSGGGG